MACVIFRDITWLTANHADMFTFSESLPLPAAVKSLICIFSGVEGLLTKASAGACNLFSPVGVVSNTAPSPGDYNGF